MCDGKTRRVFAGGVLAAVSLVVWGFGWATQAPDPVAERCILSPTARCVAGLSLAAAESVVDASWRADALAGGAMALAEAGETGEARKDLSRALAAAEAIDNTPYIGQPWVKTSPDDEAFHGRARVLSGIATVLAKMGAAGEAREMFSRALAAAEKIETAHYRADGLARIAKAQVRTSALQDARETLARADLPENAWYLLAPDKIARMQAQAGDVAGALVTARALPGDSGRPDALADVAAAQAAAGDVAGALVTADSIEHTYLRMVAVHYIGAARAKAGDIAGAWAAAGAIGEIWRNARDGISGPRDVAILHSDTILSVVEAHVAAGEFEKALAATEAMEDPFAFVEAHAAVAKAQAASGEFAAARVTAEGTCGWHPRYHGQCVETLTGIAAAHTAAGNAEEGQKVLELASVIAEEIPYDRTRAGAFAAIHAAQMRMGDVEGARRAMSAALAAANEIEDMNERAEGLTGIGIAAAREGDAGGAARAFLRAVAAAGKIQEVDERARALVHTGLARSQAGDADGTREAFSRALATAMAIETAGRRAKVLAEIASALATGRWPEAEDPF